MKRAVELNRQLLKLILLGKADIQCYCLLLKQVIDSHKFKRTDVVTGNHIYNTDATKNTE